MHEKTSCVVQNSISSTVSFVHSCQFQMHMSKAASWVRNRDIVFDSVLTVKVSNVKSRHLVERKSATSEVTPRD